jgi:hypothetical protein
MKGPRTPTPQEYHDIGQCIGGDGATLDGAAVAIFDDYITDGPGYHGKIAMVVWPGGPDLSDVFVEYKDPLKWRQVA